MTELIKNLKKYLKLGILFFQTYAKLLQMLESLVESIDELIKEQKKLHQSIENYAQFDRMFREQGRKEKLEREEEIRPSSYDYKY